jgi:hypothetical protein
LGMRDELGVSGGWEGTEGEREGEGGDRRGTMNASITVIGDRRSGES